MRVPFAFHLLLLVLHVAAVACLVLPPNAHRHVAEVAACMNKHGKCSPSPYHPTQLQFHGFPGRPMVEIGQALSSSDVAHLIKLATCVGRRTTEEVLEDGVLPAFSEHSQDRQFEGQGGGNRVVFLNEFLQRLSPWLYWKIRSIAHTAVAPHVELFRHKSLPEELGIRVIEVLQYNDTGFSSEVAWHTDQDSVYTMVLLLSQKGQEFKGGRLLIKNDKGQVEHVEPNLGAGAIFDSERDHAVNQVIGRRTVLVVEFWKYQDSSAYDSRPDTKYGKDLPRLQEPLPDGCEADAGVYQAPCWGYIHNSVMKSKSG